MHDGAALDDKGAMTATNTRLTAAVEAYFADLRRVRASGGATGERSSYGPLAGLLNAVGATLKPKVFCVRSSPTRARAIPISASIRLGRSRRGRFARGRCRSAASSR